MKQLPFHCSRSKVPELFRTKVAAIYVVCVLTILGASLSIEVRRIGWTVPEGDISVKTGESLEIFCTLSSEFSKTYNARHLVFYRNAEKIEDIYMRPFNETTNRLHIENMAESKNWYYCKLAVTPTEEDLVGSNIVAVGSEPQDVTNFTCDSMNWEVLNCSWMAPHNFVHTEYDLSYSLKENDSRIYRCPTDDDRRNNNCKWTINSVPKYNNSYRKYLMHVVGRNDLGNRSQDIPVDIFERIKLNLKCVNATADSQVLSCKIGTLILVHEESILYKVQYAVANASSENGTTICSYSKGNASVTASYTCQNGTINMDKDEMFLNVSVPYAGANYIFNVSFKVGFAPEGHWSQPATVTC